MLKKKKFFYSVLGEVFKSGARKSLPFRAADLFIPGGTCKYVSQHIAK